MILAIDPGSEQSAVVVIDQGIICWPDSGIRPNDVVRKELFENTLDTVDHCTLVIEKIESYGMVVGATVFKTVWWTGRFHEAFGHAEYLPRKDVKLHLCNNTRAKDVNIKAALIERFGHPGTKKNPGWMYGIKKDLWAALAVAVTWLDREHRGWDRVEAKSTAGNEPW